MRKKEQNREGRGGDASCSVNAMQGKLPPPRGNKKRTGPSALFPCEVYLWGHGSAGGLYSPPPPSTRVCTHTHACNTYTPIEKVHTKICWSNVKSESCRPSKLDYTGRSHNWPLARLKLHRAKNFLFSLIFFFSLNNTQIFLLGKLSVGIILGVL